MHSEENVSDAVDKDVNAESKAEKDKLDQEVTFAEDAFAMFALKEEGLDLKKENEKLKQENMELKLAIELKDFLLDSLQEKVVKQQVLLAKAGRATKL